MKGIRKHTKRESERERDLIKITNKSSKINE